MHTHLAEPTQPYIKILLRPAAAIAIGTPATESSLAQADCQRAALAAGSQKKLRKWL